MNRKWEGVRVGVFGFGTEQNHLPTKGIVVGEEGGFESREEGRWVETGYGSEVAGFVNVKMDMLFGLGNPHFPSFLGTLKWNI